MDGAPPPELARFWSRLQAALALQLAAVRLAEGGDTIGARACERRALLLLLEVSTHLRADEPAAGVVGALASAGLARLERLRRVSGRGG